MVLLAQPFSFATLSYPDNSSIDVWLPDGTVEYFVGKHVVLFIAALVILLTCIGYSLLLLCWQLILHCPDWKILKWIRNPKFYAFMEAYHVLYVPRHRYWTGLLLLARAILYLIAAATVSRNPQIQLISIIVTLSCFTLLKMFIATKIFKKKLLDVLDSFFYFNTMLFAAFTSYSISTGNYQMQQAIAHTSVVLSFIVLLFVILYHVNTHTTLLSVLHDNETIKNITGKFETKPVHTKLSVLYHMVMVLTDLMIS